MEQIPIPSTEKAKQPSLYPERPSVGIEAKIQKLADFESGKAEKIPLNAEEREEIQGMEDVLGSTLEKIFEMSPKEAILYGEYFQTDEGKQHFEKLTGVSLTECTSPEEIEKVLWEASSKIAKLGAKERGELVGKSRDYSETVLFEKLKAGRDTEGNIDIKDISAPHKVILPLEPQECLGRLKALKKFKDYIKRYREAVDGPAVVKSDEYKEVLKGILGLYQSRTNEMLAGAKTDVLPFIRKRELLGEEGLLPEERDLLSMISSSRPEATLGRYDKYLFGVEDEYDAKGDRPQVGKELEVYAERLEDEQMAVQALKSERVREQGIDPEKLFQPELSSDEVVRYAEETLAAYGLLSEEPAEKYSKDRKGPAADNKWQFVVRDDFKTMAVDSKQKVVKCGKGMQSMGTLVAVTLAHEIEGHVLQHENKSRIPLRLFKKIGSGRSSIFAECGAMSNEDAVSQKAFGYAAPPHPHYIRAMLRKLEGGNYQECLEAFYESSLRGLRLQKSLGKITEEEFVAQSDKKLKLAINRAKRLFGGSMDTDSSLSYLSHSKDTVYLEQMKLFEELKKQGLEKYVFVGGANLDALVFLMESGFLNPEDIEEPKYHALEVWDREKEKYALARE
jgi:hypothetical protein